MTIAIVAQRGSSPSVFSVGSPRRAPGPASPPPTAAGAPAIASAVCEWISTRLMPIFSSAGMISPSTAAMVSCCAHYLVNVAPVLGATSLVAFAAQFQVELFWVGLAFSAAGIAFVLSRLWKAEKEHAKCAV